MSNACQQLEAALRSRFGWAQTTTGSGGREMYVYTICPRCGKRKLAVNVRTGYYKCWRECGEGRVEELLGGNMPHLDLSTLPPPAPEEPMRFRAPGYVVSLASLPESHHAVKYLRERGFDPAHLERTYGVGYCFEGNEFAWGRYNTTDTLLFPIHFNGQLVAWQSRLLYNPDLLTETECYAKGMVNDPDPEGDGKLMRFPKYFTMPGFRKGSLFFNYDWARQSELVVVTEGVFDAMAVGRCAVACLGKGVSPQQKSMISAYWKMAILLLDPDAEAENLKLGEHLQRNGTPCVCVKLANDMDAGETPHLDIWTQIYEECQRQHVDLAQYRVSI